MGKIGRNQACPCGSGKKHKHCCLPAAQAGATASPAQQMKTSLLAAIAAVQEAAAVKKVVFQELGVFMLYSDSEGDAWLLEITETDALQIAAGGAPIEVPIDENPETIEINFSHTFAIREKRLYLTAYAGKTETLLDRAPSQQIHAAIRRVRKRFPAEMLSRMHLNETAAVEEAE